MRVDTAETQVMAAPGLVAAYREQRAQLLRLLAARLGSAADAEDALQDLWLRVAANPQPELINPAAYLMRMANNLATDRRIAAQRRAVLETDWAASGDVATSPIRLVGPSAPLSSAASASPGAPVLLRAPQSFSGASLHGLRAPVRARGEPERRAEVVRQVRVVGVAQLVRERRQVEARIHPELLGRLL